MGITLYGAAQFLGFVLVTLLMLVWSTAAFAQSREDQYGSPTDPVDPVSTTLSVLPDTGGLPIILFVGAALIIAGTGMAILRRRASHR